jgi:hypothetical protein
MPSRASISVRTLLFAAAVGGLFATARPLFAMHRQTPFLVDLSDYPGGFSTHPGPPQGEPNHVYFQSSSDLKNNGSSGSQIFFYVLRPNNPDSNTLRQITNHAGDSENPSANDSGWVTSFDSNADIVGIGNGFRQIFLSYRAYNFTIIQLTDGQADSTLPVLDFKGDLVTFQSMADLAGSGLPTGYSQVYLYRLLGGNPPCTLGGTMGCHPDPSKLVQITNWAGNSTNPYVAAFGGAVVFQSDVFGSQQIFLYDLVNGGLITQITNGAGDSTNPTIDETSNFITFQSNADLLGNGSTGSQIYYYDRERDSLRQITAGAGDSSKPSLGGGYGLISFISTADLLSTGASGQNLFIFDPRTLHLFQATKQPGSTSDDPKSAGNFVLFDTDEDIMGTGMTGTQVYSLNTFGRIPKIAIGKRIMSLQPQGGWTFSFGDRDMRSEGTFTITGSSATLPPLAVPNYGTFCFKVLGDGHGTFDCRGGRDGGDLVLSQDHDTDDVDYTCSAPGACREGDACRLPLLSPHRKPCPACVTNACTRGPYAGQLCFDDETCLVGETCNNGGIGVCNGPIRTDHAGAYEAGGMLMSLPLSISLSRAANRDNVWCTADDEWVFQDLQATLDFTTGTVTTTIDDTNDAAAASLVATDTGTPFDCQRLEKGNFQSFEGINSAFVGQLPLLDVPTLTGALQDVVLPVHLTAFGGNPYTGCTTLSCRIITYCTSNADCDDGSVCNGQETCVNNTCTSGSPLLCDDGNACNGVETCDPLLGCQPGPVNACDDGALCSADGCDINTGQCTHTFIPGCCTSDADCRDTNVCNGAEHCVAGNCVSGTPLVCDDGNACNGTETCDPTIGCQLGLPPNCNDGARCTTDTCDPGLGCVHTSVHGCCTSNLDCRDTNVCNGEEGCSNGDCVPGTPLVCDDNDACNGTETCDPLSGCTQGTPLLCLDDGAPCTSDYCDPTNGCVHASISGCCTADTDCQDTDACNGLETCVAGDCYGGVPLVCNDNNVCNGVETCSPQFGCLAGAPLACGDDGAVCTADTCDAVLGCIHTSIPGCCTADADCQDTSACNGLERCIAGDCVAGTPLFCDDGDACNGTEVCDDTLGCTTGTAPAPFTFEGVQCTLTQLWNAFRAESPANFGGRNQYTKFEAILVKVRRHFGYVSPKDNGIKARYDIKAPAALKFLKIFERRLKNGMRNGLVVEATGNQLIDLADQGILGLLEFNAQAPRPPQ